MEAVDGRSHQCGGASMEPSCSRRRSRDRMAGCRAVSGRLLITLFFLCATGAAMGDSGNGGGLKLIALSVPDMAEYGESASLECRFDLGTTGANLYSVKWYKDDHEFFRYTPDDRPPHTQLFPVQGINLDEAESGVSHVTLRQLSFDSSGNYRCEVSTEAPDFKTVLRSKHMTVWAPPRNDPAVEGVKPSYAVGEDVIGNCTSSSSYPAAKLLWYLNGKTVNGSLVVHYAPWSDDNGLQTTRLGIRFTAEAHHFRELSPSSAPPSSATRRVLELRCSATVQRQTRHRVVRSRLTEPVSLSTQKLEAHDSNKGNAAASVAGSKNWLSATCAWFAAFLYFSFRGVLSSSLVALKLPRS
ncbi:uncharacterized protein LOC124157742 [Ischnura elegans]|uniref:uncharacterized protein LOC124157742 n=1 Tax=Ischnura elegans TaxID=197161 RepID=UPI001ED8750D|nr:uncharacterized protein LOC124157742 [Ischnura elegans]